MNYSDVDKAVNDMETEIDSVCKMIALLYKYNVYNDLLNGRILSESRTKHINKKKRDVLDSLCAMIRIYRVCQKKAVTNNYYIADRKVMNSKITDMYLKTVMERIEIEKNLTDN